MMKNDMLNEHAWDTSKYLIIEGGRLREGSEPFDKTKCEKCGGRGYSIEAGVNYFYKDPCPICVTKGDSLK
jgi:hypothetical protein